MSLIFNADFEAADFSEWTSTGSGGFGPAFNATSDAGLNGTYGVDVDNVGSTNQLNQTLSGVSVNPATVRFGCRFDFNNLVTGGGLGNALGLFDVLGTVSISFLVKDNGSGVPRCTIRVVDLFASVTDFDTAVTGSGAHTLEIKVVNGTGASDAEIYIYIDGSLDSSNTSMDLLNNFDGASTILLEGDTTWSSGVWYMDDVTFRDDDTEIFPPVAPDPYAYRHSASGLPGAII